MENQSKQRIVGAIVMAITLAVFLFFLLHNPSVSEVPPVLQTLPKIESQKVSEISFELPASQQVMQKAMPVPAAPVSVPTQIPTSASPPSTSTPKSIPSSALVSPVSTVAPPTPTPTPVYISTLTRAPTSGVPHDRPTVTVQPQPVVAQKVTVLSPARMSMQPESKPAPASVVPKEAPELRALQMMAPPQAWVLQLGTFSSAWRADHLVSELRVKGFDVYTRTTARSYGRVSVHVFVGPKIHRADIEAIRAQLVHDFHLYGVIRKYEL